VRHRATTTLILALAAGFAAGCGGDDESGEPIPQQAAADLESRLAEVERRMEAGGGACADIQNDTLPAIDSTIDSLPDDVDPDVRDALVRSFERLFELVQAECDEQRGQEEEQPAPVEPEPAPTIPPDDEEDDDEGEEDSETPPPTETGPSETEPPVEVPPEEGATGESGQGGSGTSGQGGSGTADQGGGGGALVPEGGQ
jgi:hypothetical protein